MLQNTFVWHDDNRAEAIEMWSDGKTIRQIAEHFGVTLGTVAGHMARNRDEFPARGEARNQTPFRWNDTTIAKAAALWDKGKTGSEIAAELGCSRGSVVGLAFRMREKFPGRGKGHARLRPTPNTTIGEVFPQSKGAMADFERYRLPGQTPIFFVDTTDRTCKFPVSNGGGLDMLCCGAEATARPYCGAHAALAWRPRT